MRPSPHCPNRVPYSLLRLGRSAVGDNGYVVYVRHANGTFHGKRYPSLPTLDPEDDGDCSDHAIEDLESMQ